MARLEAPRRHEVASNGWRGSAVCRARSCFSSWQEEEDNRARGGLGLAWASGKLFPIFSFLVFLFCYLLLC